MDEERDLATALSGLDWGAGTAVMEPTVAIMTGPAVQSDRKPRLGRARGTVKISDADRARFKAEAEERDRLAAPVPQGVVVGSDVDGLLAVEGAAPVRVAARVRRNHHKPKPSVAEPVVAAVPADVAALAASALAVADATRVRRPRDTPPDILTLRAESPAVVALFETMWKEVGHKLAMEVGRPKASRQDAALGWYMLLLAMRARDAR